MNYFDIILAIPIVWGAYKGFTKGLIIELASLSGLVLGLYLGVNFSSYAANLLPQYVSVNPQYLPIVSFAITFLGVVCIVFLLAKLLEKVINFIALKFVNKIAGACFGILKYALIFSALLFIFDTVDKQFRVIPETQKSNSKLYPLIQSIVPAIAPQINNFDILKEIEIDVPDIDV